MRLEIIDKTAPVVSIALPVNLCVGQGCLPSLEKFPIPEYLFSIPNNIGMGIQGQAEKRANLPYLRYFLLYVLDVGIYGVLRGRFLWLRGCGRILLFAHSSMSFRINDGLNLAGDTRQLREKVFWERKEEIIKCRSVMVLTGIASRWQAGD